MDPEDCKTIEQPALGRPFSLGMLYDCRTDALIPGMTLWDHDVLEKGIRERPQPNSEFEIVASESIEDKSSALNVNAALKASFLGGLVQVEGSAKYLNDCKTSKNQARVTFKYKTTTKFQELSMNHLGRGNVKHPEVFDKGIATHVVTGILYGAQAFFVFDREVSAKKNHQDIEGNLKVMIKKIPNTEIGGEGSLQMRDMDTANVQKFSCKFHGDFSLERNPVSFQDAIQVYQNLPKLLGANGENAVPMKVWLMPLKILDSSAAQLVRQISIRLVVQAQSVLEDLSELEMRCSDAMKSTTTQQFPQIRKKLKTFKELCSEYKLEFQRTLAKKLPSIRGGGEEEAVLAEVLKKRHSSPFNSKNLSEWISCKEREINILKSLTDKMKNTKTVTTHVLDQHVFSAEHAVCFAFTSLENDEPYLSALLNYLRETNKPDSSEEITYQTHDVKKEQWYFPKEVMDAVRQKAKIFTDFAETNKASNIRFLTVGKTNGTQKGATIHLYKEGSLVSENFEPPSKPEKPAASDTTHNSVTVKICPPKFGAEDITEYSVEYCVSGEDDWQQKTVSKAGEVTVSSLTPNTEYLFRYRAVCSVGKGPASEVSGPITTLPTSPPGKPQVEPNVWTTKPGVVRLAEFLKDKSKLINSASPSVYKLPLKKEDMDIGGCRRYSFGNETTKRNCTIMVLGATGSGKSTLINGMINYIVGVEWSDSFRFKLIDEGQLRSQAESQTSEVTAYKINHQEGFKIDYSLTIVDTPGFGDTRGIERDRMITEQLRNLFSAKLGVSEIDAVCFVVQAPLARLTPTQKYVFDSVLSIFGKDVAENIRILVTFADGQRPPVLEAINASEVPCSKTDKGVPVHFKFNNSALYADNKLPAENNTGCDDDEDDGSFDKMFWDMGIKSMKNFFAALNLIKTKSLTLTKEVLRERRKLENSVENLQQQVKLGLAKLEEIKEETEILQTHEAEITKNEKFEYEVTVKKPVQDDISSSGNYITNCQQCQVTCHYPCSVPNYVTKYFCEAIGSNGCCTECTGKCYWTVHFNQNYRWVYKDVKEKRTVQDLKDKYQKATEAKMSVQDLVRQLEAEYDDVQVQVVNLMERSAKCLDRLKEIALKPNPLSTPEYIDLLIEGEKSEAKPGWKQRVQALIAMREKAVTMAQVAEGQKLL